MASGRLRDVTDPAVPIVDAIAADGTFLVCLEDGMRMTLMKRHLSKNYGLTPDEYRERWSLPRTFPMTAPVNNELKRLEAERLGAFLKPYESAQEAAHVATRSAAPSNREAAWANYSRCVAENRAATRTYFAERVAKPFAENLSADDMERIRESGVRLAAAIRADIAADRPEPTLDEETTLRMR